SGRGMSTMPRVVKRKLQKLRPIVEYNKRGKGIGQAHSEMQSYIGVLARSRVPLVDMKWAQIPKDIKEQIWEAVDIAFVKWKDFKSTLTRHYILPYTNDRERLSQPPETYKFIEKAQWDAFVASRLSKDFESVHSQHAQIREKLEYNHRLSRKGYAGLEDQLEETMPGDELQKQVSEGKVSVYGSNDVLTMALGPEHPGRVRGVGAGISPRQYFNLPKPQRMSFDDRLKDSLRVLLQEENKKMEAKAREEALRMEARTKQLVEAEREHFLSQLSQLIPNFDPSMLKPRISQSPKNPMSDKASCSGGDVRSLHFEDDTAKNGKHQEEKTTVLVIPDKNEGNQDEEKNEEKKDEEKEEEKKDEEKKEEKQDEKEKEDEEKHDDQVIKVVDYSNMEAPSSLKTLCRYVETTLVPQDKTLNFTIDKEVFGLERDTFVLPEDITQFAGMEEIGATVVAVYMRYLHDLLKQANMCSMVGFIDPATVSANSGTIADRSRLVAARLQKTDGEQIFMMPYNPGRHWILLIVRAKRETVYFLDPLPGNRVVDEEGKNIVNSAIKIYNSHIARAGRKAVIWKTLSGTPKQPSSVECGYYVMRFMRDIIMDPSLAFEKKYAKGKQEAPYPQEAIDEVRNEWAEFVCLHME
ncbi:PREDICTED: ubiquitin-like-specific protease, partial [Prunus dulcis]